MQVVTLSRQSYSELFITAVPVEGESAASMFGRVGTYIREKGASVVSQEIYGVADGDAGVSMLNKAFGDLIWPVTWVEQNADKVDLQAGMHVWAVTDLTVRQISLGGKIVGTAFEDSFARYCRIGGIGPDNAKDSRTDQAIDTFEKLVESLAVVRMDFSKVVRTWFYNDDILSWYSDFNKVRNDFFKANGIFKGLVPASTGIGGSNWANTALVSGLLAVAPKNSEVTSFAVPSPLQEPALDYGSSFSRAVEVQMPDHRRVLISGTASIDHDGNTVHLDDVEAQIDFTMKVAKAILESRKMDWSNVTRVTAYFKHAKDVPVFEKYCKSCDIELMPIVVMQADICREGLLYEIEVDAIAV